MRRRELLKSIIGVATASVIPIPSVTIPSSIQPVSPVIPTETGGLTVAILEQARDISLGSRMSVYYGHEGKVQEYIVDGFMKLEN